MKFLICGYGNIGKHIVKEFTNSSNEIYIYDKYKEEYSNNHLLLHNYDVIFICAPTEKLPDGHADVSEVKDICNIIHNRAKVVIIKSAIPVGTCRDLGYKNIVISPEYYGTTQHSLESPNFAVIGGYDDASNLATAAYQTVKNGSFRFIYVDWETAELAKYMDNCWLAAKVTFCNEFASIASSYGIQYPKLRECFIADERVNPSHTFVYPDKPYFDSHCLNKDIPALIEMCNDKNIDTPLMDTILKIKENKSKEE